MGGSGASATHSSAMATMAATAWRTTVLINLAMVVEQANEQVLPAVYLFVGRALNASPVQLGTLTLCRAMVQTLASPLSGVLGDRYDRVLVLASGAFIWGVMTSAMAMTVTLRQAMAFAGINGLGLALLVPCCQSLTADLHPAERRGRAFGTLQLTASLGGMLGGVFATNIGGLRPFGVDGWRFAFHCVAAASLLVGALTLWLAVDPRHAQRVAAAAGGGAYAPLGLTPPEDLAPGLLAAEEEEGGGGGDSVAVVVAAGDRPPSPEVRLRLAALHAAGAGGGDYSSAGAAAAAAAAGEAGGGSPRARSQQHVSIAVDGGGSSSKGEPLLLLPDAARSPFDQQLRRNWPTVAPGDIGEPTSIDSSPAKLHAALLSSRSATPPLPSPQQLAGAGDADVDADDARGRAKMARASGGHHHRHHRHHHQGGGGSGLLPRQRGVVADVLWMLRIRTFQAIVLQGIVGCFPWQAMVFFTLWLQLQGFSNAAASALVATFGAGVACGALLGGAVGDRMARRLPNSGRIFTAQFSVFCGIPLTWLLLKGLPPPGTGGGAGAGAGGAAAAGGVAAASLPWFMPSALFAAGGSGAAVAYLLALFLMGLTCTWAGAGCNSPIFAEIVPDELRSTIYAFDRSFENSIAACAAPAVGLLAERVFGFSGAVTDAALQDQTLRQRNADALGSSLLTCMVVPWCLCLLFYSFLHVTYPRDRAAAARRAAVAAADGGGGGLVGGRTALAYAAHH